MRFGYVSLRIKPSSLQRHFVSIDEILVGSNGTAEKMPLKSVKLLRRIQRIERLPDPRQRVVLKFIDALIDQESKR